MNIFQVAYYNIRALLTGKPKARKKPTIAEVGAFYAARGKRAMLGDETIADYLAKMHGIKEKIKVK